MAIEIEKKFLLSGSEWKQKASGTIYRQGYIPTENTTTVRVRTAGDQGFITIKGKSVGAARSEYEYLVPIKDAEEMLDSLCQKPIIEKTRFTLTYEGFVWEIDEFAGENKGLIVAEIELEHENQEFTKPPWVGREVTGDPRYYNARLGSNPFCSWNKGK